MQPVTQWIEAHPVLTQLVWPAISALVLWLFKPRTPADYASLNPRVAGFLMFVSGLGLDPMKVTQGLRRVLTGKSIPMESEQINNLISASTLVDSKPRDTPTV